MLQSGHVREGGCSISDVGSRITNEQWEQEGNQDNDNIQNPMIKSAFLTRMFKFCKLSDLLTYRLVSKMWYFTSMSLIRNEIPVRINLNSRKTLNWSNMDKEFIMSGDGNAPFRFHLNMDFVVAPGQSKGTIECSTWTKALAEKTNSSIEKIFKNIELFWVEHGYIIRKLTLHTCHIFSAEAFRKAIFEDTPNLEELDIVDVIVLTESERQGSMEMGRLQTKLRSLNVRWCQNSDPFPIPWLNIFLQFPKIQKLKLELNDATAIPGIVKAYESYDEIQLNELKLRIKVRGQGTSLKAFLQLPKLKLSKLELDVYGCRREERSILQVALGKLGSGLTELRLYTFYHDDREDLSSLKFDALQPINNFPFRQEALEQLTHLELRGFVSQKFHFLEHTPYLRVLRLYNPSKSILDVDEGDLDKMKKTRLPFLKEFWFWGGGKCLSAKQMEVLSEMMPNIEFFRGEMDPTALRVICKNWRNLRSLQLDFCKSIDDEALTGIKDGCEDCHFPNITNLTALREFCFWWGGKIGDLLIRNALLNMPQLCYVSLHISPETSQESIDALRKQIPGGQVYTPKPISFEVCRITPEGMMIPVQRQESPTITRK